MSNPALAVRIYPEIERTVAFGSITGAYTPVGTPTAHQAIQVILQNLTDELVSFSWDGVNSAITLNAMTSFILDIQSNRGMTDTMVVPDNTQFYVKYISAPGAGAIYISVLYGAVQ